MSWTYNDWNLKNNKDFGKWTYIAKGANEAITVAPPPTDESIIEDILKNPNLEDKGFFEEMVAWLRKDAPRKLRGVLNDLYPWSTGLSKAAVDLSYTMLCSAVYNVGFRASEMLEKRMILGHSNKWVKKYFKDFPVS